MALRGGQTSSRRIVLHWFHQYERGKLDVSRPLRSERPLTTVAGEMIYAVRLMINDDPHVRYQQIDFCLGSIRQQFI